eukprot:2608400-Pyramimonas_sp.AAC.1
MSSTATRRSCPPRATARGACGTCGAARGSAGTCSAWGGSTPPPSEGTRCRWLPSGNAAASPSGTSASPTPC